MRTIEDYGLKKPWFWDEFMRGLDSWHHSLHMGMWWRRPTLWWKPKAGVSKEEREWLREEYPNWEKIYGEKWDVIIDNINANSGVQPPPVRVYRCIDGDYAKSSKECH